MSIKPSLQELLEVQNYFGLPSPALVEKDYYVVQALAAILTADLSPWRVVLGGGTSLCRAYGLIRRMSEDVDLKLVGEPEPTRSELRQIRERITAALLAGGFVFNPQNSAHRESRNATRYTVFRLPYAPLLQGEGILRPEIQVEVVVSPLRRPAQPLTLASFVAQAFDRPPEAPAIDCTALDETAAEKFVALTRRTVAEIADAGGKRDPTLVRHIYDLHMMQNHYGHAEFAELARAIIVQDAAAFGNQFPAYRDDPWTETRRAIASLQTDSEILNRYEQFQRNMVYGERVAFTQGIASLIELSELLHAT